jgi:uncharacterized membrane protein YeaQ/YmgE (transglycosylase-associated protein family)
MDFILWIVLGALAGWIASIIMKTDASQGLLGDIILGIVGAFVGGLVFNLFGAGGANGFNVYSLIVAIVGAVLVIYLGRVMFRTRGI